uniref:HDC02975 n=1 Tax=Drosophila melanogaster TaxID=7227 RepID=Q6IH96_DROME|nr:TPA_inf: HDC02975 [Drosophila melanogaster]
MDMECYTNKKGAGWPCGSRKRRARVQTEHQKQKQDGTKTQKKSQARTTTHRTQKGPRNREPGENKGHNFDARAEGTGRRTMVRGWISRRRRSLDGPNNAQVQLDKCQLSHLRVSGLHK